MNEINSNKNYILKYIVDDDINNNTNYNHDIINFNQFESNILKEDIDICFFAITNISTNKKNKILKTAIQNVREVRVLNHEFNSIKLSPSLNRPVLFYRALFDSKEFNDYEINSSNGHKDSILLTGGSGYIGSHLLKILLENNHRVILLDNFLFGKKPIQGC